MADKIAKLLAKLPRKQLDLLEPVVKQILLNELENLDVKALKRHKGFFRVRIGSYRIIFTISTDKKSRIVSIRKRNEKTYKNL